MGDVEKNINQTVVVSESPRKRFRWSQRKTLFALVVLAVVIVAAVGSVALHIEQVHKQKAEKIAKDKQAYNTAFKAAGGYAAAEQPAQAISTWKDYLKNNDPQGEQKAQADLAIGNIYNENNDPKTALDWYKQAEASSPTPDSAVDTIIAEAARRAGDDKTALTYFKKAYDIKKQLPPDIDLIYLKNQIKILGGQP